MNNINFICPNKYKVIVNLFIIFFVFLFSFLSVNKAFAVTYSPVQDNSDIIPVNIPPYDSSNPEHFLITPTNNGWNYINSTNYRYFYVAPGTYAPVIIWQKGTVDKPRYISLYNGNNTHPAMLGESEQANVKISFYGASMSVPSEYWVIDRMSSLNRSSSADGISINVGHGVRNIIFNRLHLKNFYAGIYIQGTEGYIENTNITIQNSRFDGESLVGIDDDQAAIMLLGSYQANTFTRVSNTHIINNEIVNSNDGIHLLRYVSTEPSYVDYQGTKIINNIIYVDERMYTDCNGNMDSSGMCAITEGAIDIKAGSDDPNNPIIIKNNIMWGFRNTDKVIGGSGDPGISLTMHFHVKNVIIENNIMSNSVLGVGCAAPRMLDYACENIAIKNNVISNILTNSNITSYYDKDFYSHFKPYAIMFLDSKNIFIENNVFLSKTDFYVSNSEGNKIVIPFLGNVNGSWLYIYTPSNDPTSKNENLILKNNAIMNMLKINRNYPTIPGTVNISNNYLYNTEAHDGEGTVFNNSESANLVNLRFSIDNFTNNPKNIVLENVISTGSSPHGLNVGLSHSYLSLLEDPSPTPDTTLPSITTFTIPSTNTTLSIPITTLTATDNIGVTGYLLTENPTTPSAISGPWTSTIPTSYTFSSSGTKTLYAWAKDEAGNVSLGANDSINIVNIEELIFHSGFENNTSIISTADPKYFEFSGTDLSVSSPNSWTGSGLERGPYITSAKVLIGDESTNPDTPQIVVDPKNSSNKVLKFTGTYPNENLSGDFWTRKFRMQPELYSSQGGFDTLYYKIKMLLPNDFEVMKNRTEAITWFTIAEFWNESSGGNMFRITLTVAKLNTGPDSLKFRLTTESYNGTSFTEVFSKNNLNFDILLDTWMDLEVNIIEGDNNNGKIYLAVTPEGGTKQVIFNETTYTHHPNMEPNGINYISPMKLYTYGYLADAFRNAGKKMEIYWDDFEIWNGKIASIPTPDTTKPVVSSFTIPTTSTTLSIPITTLTATDNIGVTGYLLTENPTTPSAISGPWTSTIPTSYTFSSSGTKTLYAWARDEAGNVSVSVTDQVTITLPSVNTGGASSSSSSSSSSSGGRGSSSSSSSGTSTSTTTNPNTIVPTNPIPTTPTSPSPIPTTTIYLTERLYKGIKGQEVIKLQTILSSKGYYFSTIDGSFGPKTEQAVKLFQSSNNLIPDGIVGTKSRQILNQTTIPTTTTVISTPQPISTTYTLTKKLSFRSPQNDLNEVKLLQQILISKGYLLDTNIDGRFGPKTLQAVISFQKANNLTPDGIVGTMTRMYLNK